MRYEVTNILRGDSCTGIQQLMSVMHHGCPLRAKCKTIHCLSDGIVNATALIAAQITRWSCRVTAANAIIKADILGYLVREEDMYRPRSE